MYTTSSLYIISYIVIISVLLPRKYTTLLPGFGMHVLAVAHTHTSTHLYQVTITITYEGTNKVRKLRSTYYLRSFLVCL